MTTEETRAQVVEKLTRINRSFMQLVPHNGAVGIEVVELGEAFAHMRLPFDPRLVGDPVRGLLHGGVVTTLMDACCGAAVFQALSAPVPIATLDLRIDYLKPATASVDVFARCECYKVTSSVAFVRGFAFHEAEDPIAAAAGSFMLATRSGSWSDAARRKEREQAGQAPGDDGGAP